MWPENAIRTYDYTRHFLYGTSENFLQNLLSEKELKNETTTIQVDSGEPNHPPRNTHKRSSWDLADNAATPVGSTNDSPCSNCHVLLAVPPLTDGSIILHLWQPLHPE
jgi:hypothetical protein